jgi:hypothetical protein
MDRDGLTYSCRREGQGTDWTEAITRVHGGNRDLDSVGGEVDRERAEHRF